MKLLQRANETNETDVKFQVFGETVATVANGKRVAF